MLFIILLDKMTFTPVFFFHQRTFNLILNKYGKEPKFDYTIAGGDRALLLSTEAPEDSWMAGVKDLETVC